MTYEQAKLALEKQRKAIEQAQSDMVTVKALFAIGEDDKALNMFASTQRHIRQSLDLKNQQ